MEEESASAAEELVDLFVGLDDKGNECCVVDDVEAKMVSVQCEY